METVLLGNILTALICVPFMLGSSPGSRGWLLLILSGVFQLGVPYILYATAIKHVPALDSVLITAIEPILNPLWVLWVFGERPGRWALAGGAIVLASVTVRGILAAISNNSASSAGSGRATDDLS